MGECGAIDHNKTLRQNLSAARALVRTVEALRLFAGYTVDLDEKLPADGFFLFQPDVPPAEQWEVEVKIEEDPLQSPPAWYRLDEIDEASTPKRATCTMLLDNPFSLRWITDQQRQHPLVRIVAALAVAELKFRNHRQVDQLRRDFNKLLTHSLSG